jgi:hypothetical protein
MIQVRVILVWRRRVCNVGLKGGYKKVDDPGARDLGLGKEGS